MVLHYVIGTTTFAVLCSLAWLIMGGSVLSAVGLYLISGQVAMLMLVARALLSHKRKTQHA